ncbi:cyclase family protein [Actinoplanes sp. NPDC049802]|uniref:cyclase family protein n=1 Tax=Actinoplanes sp. NPDC049802 TaxID=3154742 RepID=UPI0033F0FCFA
MLDYRAEFDAEVALEGGGELRARGFRLDIPHADVTEEEVTALLVAALAPQRVERAEVRDIRIISEPHPPAGRPPAERVRYVELSHVIAAGLVTYPGLPAPEITPHLTREASRGVYAPGTEFAVDRISMVGNTGTYLDSPFHRFPDGTDLAGLPLDRLAELPAVVVRAVGGERGVTAEMLSDVAVTGRAVLLHTGGDRHWATPAYATGAPYLTHDGARLLVDRGAALVGIDAVNIDDISPGTNGERPAHTLLLAAGIPVVEHLTNLRELPPSGARFTAAPPRVTGFGTFPVRAFATVPAEDPR